MEDEKQEITIEDLEFYLKDKKADKDIANGQISKLENQMGVLKQNLVKINQEIESLEKTLENVKKQTQ